MFPRLTPAILVATFALGLAACSSLPAATVGPASPSASATQVPAVQSPKPASAALPKPAPTSSPDSGNVEAVTPALSVEPIGAVAIRITLADPAAKAWRVTVADAGPGTGALAAASWALTVETSDVAPVITTVETQNGSAGDPLEHPDLEAGTATGRLCSLAVPVCLRVASVVLPHDGNGTLVLELGRTDTNVALTVAGATAGWPAEPFVLGAWTTTTAFPWGS